MAKALKTDESALGYAREAVEHWGGAARHGFAALTALRGRDEDSGSSDNGLSDRLGALGERLESLKAATGIGSGGPDSIADEELPIQESIDIAIPVGAVFALCKQFDEYPEFLDRVESIDGSEEDAFEATVKVGGHSREIAVEIVDQRPDERLDWECAEGLEHSGVISLHPLAPRLTRLELTVERQPEGPRERLARRLGLAERVVGEELRRFKAYAELWEEADEYEENEVPDAEALEEEGEEEELPEDEEEELPEDEEEELPEDEEDLEEEEIPEDEADEEELVETSEAG